MRDKFREKSAKGVFIDMWTTGKDPAAIVKEKGLVQISDSECDRKNCRPSFSGKSSAACRLPVVDAQSFSGFFVGAVMKESKGQANPEAVNKILTAKLNS